MVRCKALARNSVYWMNINKDIESKVECCSECLHTRKFPDKVILKPHEIPSRPFEKVGIDIVTVVGTKYQIVVDYFSKWVEVCKFKLSPTSTSVIEHLKSIFCRLVFQNVCFLTVKEYINRKKLNNFVNP